MGRKWILEHGDCLAVMQGMEDESIDAVVCDPPYGLSKHKTEDVTKCLLAWAKGESFTPKVKSGFMSQSWDNWVPGPEVWREVYRVLKPGAHMLVFAGSRSHDLMGMAIRLAGFEIKDTLSWLYASGMAHGMNISKSLDKVAKGTPHGVADPDSPNRGRWKNRSSVDGGASQWFNKGMKQESTEYTPQTTEAEQWLGWNTHLKAAWEPIILAQKPFDNTVVGNLLEYGTGALNVDGCRIRCAGGSPAVKRREAASDKDISVDPQSKSNFRGRVQRRGSLGEYQKERAGEKIGRWPANLVLSHHSECVKVGTKKVDGHKGYPNGPGGKSHHYSSDKRSSEVRPDAWTGYADPDGKETVDTWNCHPECPIGILNNQSGFSKSSIRTGGEGESYDSTSRSWRYKRAEGGFTDSGGASRFFYSSKAQTSEKWALVICGCGKNAMVAEEARSLDSTRCVVCNKKIKVREHSTVKPLDLMRWLVRLVTPPNGIVLDPFVGSGTTLLAAVQEGFMAIGIEKSANYCRIARARLKHEPNISATRANELAKKFEKEDDFQY